MLIVVYEKGKTVNLVFLCPLVPLLCLRCFLSSRSSRLCLLVLMLASSRFSLLLFSPSSLLVLSFLLSASPRPHACFFFYACLFRWVSSSYAGLLLLCWASSSLLAACPRSSLLRFYLCLRFLLLLAVFTSACGFYFCLPAQYRPQKHFCRF